MRSVFARAVHLARVHKGDIRNTVLRQVKILQESASLLSQGMGIKSQEINEYRRKDPDKANHLRDQLAIISRGLKHIHEAISQLNKYKGTSSF